MTEKQYDVIVIGAGPAGLAAALSARENGAEKVLIIERDNKLGGILNQCIHNGFGLHHFNEELTGPEYAGKFIDRLKGTDIEVRSDAMVLNIDKDRNVTLSDTTGIEVLNGKSIILAMGCRERTRSQIQIPGTRPAGIFTAGAAQRYVNMEGWLPGRRVVILGSGDIGLIMARRMSLEGAQVLACVELMPYSNGLARNIAQCLDDFNIPLYLSHTITNIEGDRRVERVVISAVDENRKPIGGTEKVFECDTVLLSVGLIPENELSRNAGISIDPHTKGPIVHENMETDVPGIFACGNVVHVHDLADFVTDEAERAGKAAAQKSSYGETISTLPGSNVGYVVPQKIRKNSDEPVIFSFRVRKPISPAIIEIVADGNVIKRIRKARLVPSEMERITLKLKDVSDTLEIRVNEETV